MTPRQALETCIDSEHAEAVIAHRKAKKCALTEYAAKLLAKEFAKHHDPNAAADEMIIRGWQGFKVEWLNDNRNSNAGAGASSPSADLMRSFGIRPTTDN